MLVTQVKYYQSQKCFTGLDLPEISNLETFRKVFAVEGK